MRESEWPHFQLFLQKQITKSNSKRTLDNYRRSFYKLCPLFAEYSKSAVDNFFSDLFQQNKPPTTINHYRRFFRTYDKYLGVSFCDLQRQKTPPPKKDTLSFEEIVKVRELILPYQKAPNSVYTQQMYSTLYCVLSELGLRINDALSLEVKNFKGDELDVFIEKIDEWNTFKITASLQRKLEAMLKHNTKLFFPISANSVREDLKRRVKILGIRKVVSPHTFRHSLADMAVQVNIQRDYVQQRLTHRSSSSLDQYIHKNKHTQMIFMKSHPFIVDSMSQEDKINYIRGKQRELEDEMRRLGVSESMLVPIIDGKGTQSV